MKVGITPAVALVLAAACGGSTATSEQSTGTTSVSAVASTAPEAAATTDPSDTTPAETEPVATEPVATEPADEPVEEASDAEPQEMFEGRFLEAGVLYETQFLDPAVRVLMPGDPDAEPWRVIYADNVRVVMLLGQEERTEGVPANSEPGLQVAPVESGSSVDDVTASVESFAAEADWFTVSVESGAFGGTEVTALRGTASWDGDGIGRIPTSDSTDWFLPSGPREFIAYLLEVDGQVILVSLDSHALDFDELVERANPVVDALEFV